MRYLDLDLVSMQLPVMEHCEQFIIQLKNIKFL